MSGELAIIAGSSVAGALSAALIDRVTRAKKNGGGEKAKGGNNLDQGNNHGINSIFRSRDRAEDNSHGGGSSRNNGENDFEKNDLLPSQQITAREAKEEFSSLIFEKALASEAITRVYEAAQNGTIDRLERDRLLVKYKNDLDSINERIAKLKPVADYAELTEMRNTLAALLEDKISALDQKLEKISKAGPVPIVIEKVQVMPIPDKVQDDSQKRQFKAEEKSIEQLQEEIVQALTRLEQIELDKD